MGYKIATSTRWDRGRDRRLLLACLRQVATLIEVGHMIVKN